MFILFLFILLTGIAGFAFVFTRAWKGRAMAQRPAAVPVPAILPRVSSESAQTRLITLQKMVEEKNRVIESLEKDLQVDHDHEAQVDRLKEIFQAEIEELKQQNRQLKAEIARFSEENIDLQTRVYAGEMSAGGVSGRIGIRPAASTGFLGNGPVDASVLQDAFSGEEKNS